jgi:hypothetical protein
LFIALFILSGIKIDHKITTYFLFLSKTFSKTSNVNRLKLSCTPVHIKVKSRLATPHGGVSGERRYSSYSFTTSALDGGEWSALRHGRALPHGKGPPLPIVQEAGWVPEPVWTQRIEEKSFAPAGDRTPIHLA